MQILPLAAELFLVGHDEYSGKPVVDGRRLDTGLAGAVLAELVQAQRIAVDLGGLIRILDDRPAGERVTGPGRLGIQSMTYHPPQPEGAQQAGGQSNINLGQFFQ